MAVLRGVLLEAGGAEDVTICAAWQRPGLDERFLAHLTDEELRDVLALRIFEALLPLREAARV